MATTNFRCNSFKDELGQAIHNFATDQFKVALYAGDGTAVGVNTTVYTATNELVATGYVAGGMNLTKAAGGAGADQTLAGANAGVSAWDWANAVWSNFTGSGIRQALIYNATKGNRAVCGVTWDAPGRSATASDFTVTLPSTGVGVVRFP